MKKKYSILKTLAVGALILSTTVLGNAKTKRMVLIEEGTNASCPPCAAQNPSFKEWLLSKKDNVIPLVWHANWPGADVMNALNPTMHDQRIQVYYGMTGVPSARVNGRIAPKTGSWYEGAPGDLAALDAALAAEMAKGESPLAIKIEQTKNGGNIDVKVTVSSDEAISNVKLRVAVTEGYIFHPNAGNNGEKEFFWVARATLPDNNGTALTLAADEEKSFTFSVPKHKDWNEGELYIVAFVQNDATKEVLQAGTNYINKTTEMTSPDPAALKAPMEAEEFTMQVKNTSEAAITYTWTLAKSGRTPSDWEASVVGASGEFEVGAGATEDLTVRLVPGATAGIGDAVLTVTPKDNPDKRSYSQQVTVLSSNVDKLNVDAEAAADAGNVGSILAETGHSGYINITAQDLDNLGTDLVGQNNLKYIVWNGGKESGLSKASGNALASLVDKGVGLLMTGQVYIPFYTQADPSAFLMTMLGIEYQADIQAFTNGTFTMTGVSGDPITNGMNLTSKIAGVVRYFMQEIVATGDAVPIISTKSPTREVGARVELDNARAVVFSFHPDVIQDVAQRKALIDKAMDWIEGFTAAPEPQAILNFQPDQPLDFGKVKVGQQQEITLELTAANAAGLEISDISEFSDDLFSKHGISIIGLPSTFPDEPITLEEGEKFSFKLRFAPTEVGMIGTETDKARLSLWTNEEGGIYTIDVIGEATESTTSVGETVSRNGEFSAGVGPNPFAGSTVVRYSLNSVSAKNVRIAMFNEQGREVALLVNNVVVPGDHTVAVDGSALPSGMYRVVMTVDGESVSLPVVSVK